MGQSSDSRKIRRAPLVALLATVVLLLLPATAARAVDGVPLYPPGIDSAYSMTSMENPDMSGPILTFEIFGLSDPTSPPVVIGSRARVMFWNAADGFNRAVGGEVPGLPDGADQRHPTVIDLSGDVYIAWQQWNDPVTATRDVWLWRGDEQGNADAGFPLLLVAGPAYSNQYAAELGVAKTLSGNHLIVTWADDRGTSGATTAIYLLDLTADTDGDQDPDYLEPGVDPAKAGDRVDPGGDSIKGQHDPVVGAKGIFWLDERDAQTAGNADLYRADLSVGTPATDKYWENPDAYEAISPRATGDGVAWLGPGIAGGPFEPWVKKVDGGAGIITVLANPQALDVSGTRFAITGGHGGNTSGDWDIFFYDKATGQNVPVCDVGGNDWDWLKVQDTPAFGSAPGGSRVVWADSRQLTNTPATDHSSLAYELYVALVPTVRMNASRTMLQLGQPLTLNTVVTPNFTGFAVAFQTGTRHSFTHPYLLGGEQVWYTGWTTLKTRTL
jgi:hypothetical protein